MSHRLARAKIKLNSSYVHQWIIFPGKIILRWDWAEKKASEGVGWWFIGDFEEGGGLFGRLCSFHPSILSLDVLFLPFLAGLLRSCAHGRKRDAKGNWRDGNVWRSKKVSIENCMSTFFMQRRKVHSSGCGGDQTMPTDSTEALATSPHIFQKNLSYFPALLRQSLAMNFGGKPPKIQKTQSQTTPGIPFN